MKASSSWTYNLVTRLMDGHTETAELFLSYAQRLTRRNLICNTLGNMAVLIKDPALPEGEGLLTKRKGVSLEEATVSDLVITAVNSQCLYWGEIPPSGGHLLNQRIFALNRSSGLEAIVHTHPDTLIGLLSQLEQNEFNFVSVDTAIVLGGPPKFFSYGLNPEADAEAVGAEDLKATCFVMPNHGLTTVGRSLSEAYHRHTSMIAEVNRLLVATVVAGARGNRIRFTPESDTAQLYALGGGFIYGTAGTPKDLDGSGS
jgi:L-fuculose-phosphate aldolase